MSQLLIDCNIFVPLAGSLKESADNPNSPMKVRGIITTADKRNQNGRIYPRSILEREISKYMQKVKTRNSMGELDHPDSSVINLKNVSHIITEMWWEGPHVYGEFEILSTPSGNILCQLLKNKVQLGVSSRAMGSVRESVSDPNTVVVEDDLELLCWDCVSTPSNHGSWVSPITESKDHSRKIIVSPYLRSQSLIHDLITELS